MSMVIIGVGNDLLGDDSVGLLVAEKLKNMKCEGVVVKKLIGHPMRVLEECLGFEKAVIIDSIRVSGLKEGEVLRLELPKMEVEGSIFSPHSIDIVSAYKILKRIIPEQVPKELVVYGINVSQHVSFGNKISDSIRKLVDEVVALIIKNELGRCLNGG